MKKVHEIAHPGSCWNRAGFEEYVFVILERDVTAPGTIRDWVLRRIKAGKNQASDPQIIEALAWADVVEARQQRGTKDDRDPQGKGG
jgi:hypothetical protein